MKKAGSIHSSIVVNHEELKGSKVPKELKELRNSASYRLIDS